MSKDLRVIGNRLLVRVDKPPERSKGGIIFAHPEAADPHATGTVEAVGYLTTPKAGTRTPIPDINVGDRVLFVRLLAITDSNPKLQTLLDDDVICIRPADIILLFADGDLSRVR